MTDMLIRLNPWISYGLTGQSKSLTWIIGKDLLFLWRPKRLAKKASRRRAASCGRTRSGRGLITRRATCLANAPASVALPVCDARARFSMAAAKLPYRRHRGCLATASRLARPSPRHHLHHVHAQLPELQPQRVRGRVHRRLGRAVGRGPRRGGGACHAAHVHHAPPRRAPSAPAPGSSRPRRGAPPPPAARPAGPCTRSRSCSPARRCARATPSRGTPPLPRSPPRSRPAAASPLRRREEACRRRGPARARGCRWRPRGSPAQRSPAVLVPDAALGAPRDQYHGPVIIILASVARHGRLLRSWTSSVHLNTVQCSVH
jgi:hypothetical protein